MRTVCAALVVFAVVARAEDPEAAASRFELGVAPIVASVTGDVGRQTESLGSAVRVGWTVGSGFRLTSIAEVNWLLSQPKLNSDLLFGFEVGGGTSLRPRWLTLVGAEYVIASGSVTPWSFPNRIELGLAGLAGVVGREVWLKPVSVRGDGSLSAATFGDAGVAPALGMSLGLRLEIWRAFFARLEVRELFFSSSLDTINGCARGDLVALEAALRAGNSVGSVPTSQGCRVDTFEGTDPATGLSRATNVPLARGRIGGPGTLWQTLLSSQLSLGVVF